MFRRALTLALIAALAAAPTTIVAQDRLSLGSITGRAIDAAGRGVDGQRVELLQGTHVVSVGTTNAFGEWSFRDVKPGEYVVRVTVRGRMVGVRLSIIGGQAIAGTLIVVPTASVSPQIGAAAGTLSSLLSVVPTVATAVAATATAQAIDTETTQLNEVILKAILEELTPTERVAFAQAVLEAIAEAGGPAGSTSPFSQYVPQLTVIVNTQGNTVPTFPPPVAVS